MSGEPASPKSLQAALSALAAAEAENARLRARLAGGSESVHGGGGTSGGGETGVSSVESSIHARDPEIGDIEMIEEPSCVGRREPEEEKIAKLLPSTYSARTAGIGNEQQQQSGKWSPLPSSDAVHIHSSATAHSAEKPPAGACNNCTCCHAWSSHAHHTLPSDHHHHPKISLDQYFSTPFYWLLVKRLPWLVGLLILQSFSASILHSYDDYMARHLIFSFFVPMVVGTGGNAGNQCSVMVTRALALGMGDSEVLRVVRKEAPVAVITSFVMAFFSFIRIIIEYPHDGVAALAISITLGLSILISIALGIAFSYGIERVKKCDPADGAAPLLTTVSDLIGIALLCGIATSMVQD
jgi:cation transporter-like permease